MPRSVIRTRSAAGSTGPTAGHGTRRLLSRPSQAEVGFHKSVQLAEIGRFDDTVTYDDYIADFSASFHDLRSASARSAAADRSASRMRAYLDPDSYLESQALAEALLDAESLGVIYPSVRHAGGTCVACFRPALVTNVRRGKTYRFTWDGSPEPVITVGR